MKVPSIVFDRIEGRPVVKLGMGREVSLGNYREILLFLRLGHVASHDAFWPIAGKRDDLIDVINLIIPRGRVEYEFIDSQPARVQYFFH